MNAQLTNTLEHNITIKYNKQYNYVEMLTCEFNIIIHNENPNFATIVDKFKKTYLFLENKIYFFCNGQICLCTDINHLIPTIIYCKHHFYSSYISFVKQQNITSINESLGEPINRPTDEIIKESINELINESINESNGEPMDELNNEPPGESINNPTDKSSDDSINEPMDELNNEPSGESINEPTDKSSDDSINESTDKTSDETINESMGEPMDELNNEPINEPINESMDVLNNEPTYKPINEPNNELINKPINEPTNKPINETIDELINESINEIINEPINLITPTNKPINELKKNINRKKVLKINNIVGRKITWYTKLDQVKAYIDANNKNPPHTKNNNYVKSLGVWLTYQKANYKKSSEIMKDEIIRKKWEEFVNDHKYKKYFDSNENLWINKLNQVKAYFDEHNKKPTITNINNDVKKLAQWLNDQSKNYKNSQKIMKTQIIKAHWEDFINDVKYKQLF